MGRSILFRLTSCGGLLQIAFVALIFSAVVGGTSFAGATDFNLGLVEGFVCPGNSELAYRLGEYESEEDFPSATNPIGGTTGGRSFFVRCEQNGQVVASGDGLLLRTIATMLGGYFLACFIPLLIGSSLVLYLIRSRFQSRELP